MKQLLSSLVLLVSLTSISYAEQTAEYCSEKCTPQHCSKYPLRVGDCKVNCPTMFDACYAALSPTQKPIADSNIKSQEALAARKAATVAAKNAEASTATNTNE